VTGDRRNLMHGAAAVALFMASCSSASLARRSQSLAICRMIVRACSWVIWQDYIVPPEARGEKIVKLAAITGAAIAAL
jgi:hypothetical protein